ncbi:DsbE family thiol:disulfide interchange protein [Halomonas organivorans]|uniref:Cytochrome c biogenesis protein CcmG/thiol:disulfide interchange protein DsbE n=1 Tax=Halomonas organivorans TaxID=257772 RepID=A0A7W5C039_9GAMM|nr:DsbE family thiol:disulfide interchange protein [Halomonas organivorans]MBB3141999.1 cytochrome c biogenesis protein CcmG/thiol:disulfide interchange protein DsbE [Halomonas organivorans]
MKRRLLLLLPLVGFLVLGGFLYQGLSINPAERDSALVAKPFPAFALSALDDPGRTLDASLLQGEVTLVNVWGEWCPTCKQEMPQLLELADRGVRLVGVDYKDSREKGRQFLAEFGNPFEVNLFDPEGSLGFDLGVYGAPESFLVDADGVIRYHHTGYISPEDVTEVILPEVEKWRD